MAREWNSAEYHRLSDPQYGWGLKVLQKLESLPLRGDEHVLDAGCGSGRVTADLLKNFPQCHVTAVDASVNMVDEARKLLAPFGKRAKVEQLDLLDLAAASAFDVVFSTAVFHWIKDHDRLFHNLFRALRPEGILLAQCGGGPNLQRLRGRAEQLMRSPQYAPYFKDWRRVWEYPGPELTAERLQRAGFVDVATGLEPAPTQLPEETTYRNFLATVILHPYLERMPSDTHAGFLGRLATQAAGDSPPFLLDYWRLNLYARRP